MCVHVCVCVCVCVCDYYIIYFYMMYYGLVSITTLLPQTRMLAESVFWKDLNNAN